LLSSMKTASRRCYPTQAPLPTCSRYNSSPPASCHPSASMKKSTIRTPLMPR
jgi:hypothetical protein